ncbi:MAG: transposase [Candidatus Zixiibacteriota bacterium]
MGRERRQSYNDPGHAHFITCSCFRRCQIFTDEEACAMLAQSINSARESHQFCLWAYVFMPDHIHLLIYPRRENYEITQILKSVKGTFARHLIADWKERNPSRLKRLEVGSSFGVRHRVWRKGGGFDRNIYSLEAVRKAIDYVEWNPVKAGFVKDAADWKWSSAAACTSSGAVLLDVDPVAWDDG